MTRAYHERGIGSQRDNAASGTDCPDCGGHGWLMEPGPDPHQPNQIGCERCNATGRVTTPSVYDPTMEGGSVFGDLDYLDHPGYYE